MDIHSVTLGLPVSNLDSAVAWYRRVFELSAPDIAPADGVVEFQLGTIWLQLGEEPTQRSGAEVVARFEVRDAAVQGKHLMGQGVAVGPLEYVPGAVNYFDRVDPDGNKLSFYSMTTEP